MSLLLTCSLAAGLLLTPPEGYVITKVATPAKAESRSRGLITSGSLPYSCSDSSSCSEKIEITLTQTGKAAAEIELPPGCSGQDTGVVFKSKPGEAR